MWNMELGNHATFRKLTPTVGIRLCLREQYNFVACDQHSGSMNYREREL